MATGFTPAESIATLDSRFPITGGTDYIAWSTDGSTEFTGMVRTAIGATGWAASTGASPAVKATANQLTSAAATGAGTISNFAIYSAGTGGTQRTEWTALDSSRTVGVGDKLNIAIADIKITLD